MFWSDCNCIINIWITTIRISFTVTSWETKQVAHHNRYHINLWLIQSFVQHMISKSLLPGLRHLQSTQTFWPLQSSSWSQSQSANYAKCYLLGKVVLILLLTGFLGHPKLDLAPWAIVLIQSIMVATLVYTTGSKQHCFLPRMHLLKTPAATYLRQKCSSYLL